MGWGGEEMFLAKRIIVKARLLRLRMRDIFGKSGIDHFCLVYRILIERYIFILERKWGNIFKSLTSQGKRSIYCCMTEFLSGGTMDVLNWIILSCEGLSCASFLCPDLGTFCFLFTLFRQPKMSPDFTIFPEEQNHP